MAGTFETMNMMSVTVERFTNLIREQIEDGDLTPVAGIGKSGIGKTESIYGLTKEMGIGFCELRLVTMTETDLLGIPTINEHNRTDWASNNLLPDAKRDGERGILVLDEITSATSTIRAAAYQLLDSKRALGNYKLPDGWLVVALGNGIDDGGSYQGMEAAFLNRCRCLRVEPDLKAWKKWAVNGGVNPSVIAFLTFMPDYLHKFNPEEMVGVFPSPRSWSGLSRKLNDRENRNGGKPLDRESIEIYAACCVGNEVSSKFSAFYEYNKSVINVEDILNGKATTDIKKLERQVMYLVVQGLIRSINHELTTSKIGLGEFKPEAVNKVVNACNWLVGISKHSLDISVMALADLTANVRDFASIVLDDSFDEKCGSFIEFATVNNVVFAKR